ATHAGATSLEGTRHRHDGAPRRHGAHSGRIWRLGLKMCPAIETYRGDDESIFNFGNGGGLETSKSLKGIAHQVGQLPLPNICLPWKSKIEHISSFGTSGLSLYKLPPAMLFQNGT